MKLYVYDHCPYCVKARMIFGFKSIPYKMVTLLNDDEETPIKMIGQKMLPILEKEEGGFLPESLDIIKYLDGLNEYGSPIVSASKNDSRLTAWLKEVREYHYALAMPRWVKMNLKEFTSPEAIDYFTRKKELFTGPFSKCLEETNQLIAKAHEHLKELEEIIVGAPYFWGDQISIDDFHVFATLRCLTTVRGLELPSKLNNYMNSLSEESQVELHWEKAL